MGLPNLGNISQQRKYNGKTIEAKFRGAPRDHRGTIGRDALERLRG
jgi:hypothetical protein